MPDIFSTAELSQLDLEPAFCRQTTFDLIRDEVTAVPGSATGIHVLLDGGGSRIIRLHHHYKDLWIELKQCARRKGRCL